MRTLDFRGYIHRKEHAVMLWHKSLECWVVTFLTPKGVLSKSKKTLYSFERERVKAITAIRSQQADAGKSRNDSLIKQGKKKSRIHKLPQEGWSKFHLRAKGLTSWDALVLRVWQENS